MTRRTVLWISGALLGIAASAALAWSASQLASQRIGLSAEPISVAAGLAPPVAPRHQPVRHHARPPTRSSKRRAKVGVTTNLSPPPTAPGGTAPSTTPPAITVPSLPAATTRARPAPRRDDSSSNDSHQGPDD